MASSTADIRAYHTRSRERGVRPVIYWVTRSLVQVFAHLYFRMSRVGREHIPAAGPVIFCCNHRSFLDPFVVGTIARRPLYYVAKQELFRSRVIGWYLNALGAFPVDRGSGDSDMLETARAILRRGDCILVFSEGTRVRPGPPAQPKRGAGRLALEVGAPIVPVAVIGTEDVRSGWRIRPHKVRIRIGAPHRVARSENPTPEQAATVMERVWPCVLLQWEALGGVLAARRVPADAEISYPTRGSEPVPTG